MDLFRVKPELISIHVPKTAGSTFHGVLQQEYGWRLKHIQAHKDLHIWNNGLLYRSNKPFVKAVHGHIEAHPNWKKQYPRAKIVAWVRDPVDRVISAFYHWKKEVDHRDARHKLFSELKPDVVEFTQMAEFALTVNAFQTYLGRLGPSDYFFIGRTEYFTEDLQKLAKALNWKSAAVPTKNVNPAKPKVEDKIKRELRKSLQLEYGLYHDLLNAANRLP